MAQRQINPRVPGSHLDRKFREHTASIAGQGRRTLFTTDLIGNGLSVGVGVLIYSVKKAGDFFRSPSDSIFLNYHGTLDSGAGVDDAGISVTTTVEFKDGSASTSGGATLLLTGEGITSYHGDSVISLNRDKSISFGSKIISTSTTQPIVVSNHYSVAKVADVKSINFEVFSLATQPSTVVVNYMRAEFSPAAIDN